MNIDARRRFKIGDEVNVHGNHPHRGESGRIVRASNVAGFDWVVSGQHCDFYITERNLRFV